VTVAGVTDRAVVVVAGKTTRDTVSDEAVKLASPGYDTVTAYGVVDAGSAVAESM
jgi:hypothetical protein